LEQPLDSLKLHRDHYTEKLKNIDAMHFEQYPFHDYFRELPFLAVKKHFDLANQSVHVASCGTGLDVHYLKKHYTGVRFHVSDISDRAVALVMKTFAVEGSVQDNENLTFPDNQFDYSFVAASLHHLLRPHKGLYELLRVSKKGVIVIEPNDSWLTRLAVRFNLATEYERDCKNYVFRYSEQDVRKIAKALFCDYTIIRLFAIHRTAKSRLEFLFLKALNKLCNLFFPSVGNYIIFAITKK
jgi:SAM-dependent methyltransferase